MKNKICTFMLVFTLGLGFYKPSLALVSAGNPVVAGLGAGVVGAGAVMYSLYPMTFGMCQDCASLGIALGLIGLVVLDQEAKRVEFNNLTLENAVKFGVPNAVREHYNEELDLLNATVESFFGELADRQTREGKLDFNEFNTLWSEYSSHLSAETNLVLNKMYRPLQVGK